MRIKKILIYLFCIIVIIIGIIQFINFNNEKKTNLEETISLEQANIMISKGETLYMSNCASCHGSQLEGKKNWTSGKDEDGQSLPPPLNGEGHSWHHSPDQLFQIIRYGFKIYNPNYQGKMQGNEILSDEDIWSILEYMKSVWPKKIRDQYKSLVKH
jgi:cytochrome c